MDKASSTAIVPISNEQEDFEEVVITKKYSSYKSNLGSLARLVVGGIALGYDELMVRLNVWENLSSHPQNTTTGDNSKTPVVLDQKQVILIAPESPNSEDNNGLIYALFGLLSESQEIAIKGLKAVDKSSRRILHVTGPIIKPFTSNRFLKPVMNRYDLLAQRGQDEVERLVNVGKLEYQHSYRLAKTAFQSTINESINTLADNPEIHNLIETQGVGLANEVIEETRERSVTADNFIDDILRALLRRPLRSELPPPPVEMQEKAIKIKVTK